jgi:hypothetical protein
LLRPSLLVPFLIFTSCLLCSGQMAVPIHYWQQPAPLVPITVAIANFASNMCSGSFVTHKLPFVTGARVRQIGTYLSNGAGVATGDLDGDGDLDLVFASVDRESSILWNQGDLSFKTQPLPARFTRGVAVVDIDGDGRLDISFTHRGLVTPSFWRNIANSQEYPSFEEMILPGVDHYAYALAWGDVDGDNALDLVTGSYAAEMKQHAIDVPEIHPQVGLVLYRRHGDVWKAQVLDRVAETLAIGIVDLTDDGVPEIWVANDFAVRDQIWQRLGEEWQLRDLFNQTSHSTMSLEWGAIGRNGRLALFTTDMVPYDVSPRTIAAWLPVMDQFGQHRSPGDPQQVANVLQVQDVHGRWRNHAVIQGIDATGWSWSGRFGDLDQDGLLDLYVVNGMIANDMFAHLPGDELVEQNQAFRNREGSFVPAPEWNLAATASGRGMVPADLDNDGDLDLVVNNLRSAAQILENQLCEGSSLQVALHWPQSANPFAIGAQVVLESSAGTLIRDVRASGGYLSGDAPRLHFGFPSEADLSRMTIVWPDGVHSVVETPIAQGMMTITRLPEE